MSKKKIVPKKEKLCFIQIKLTRNLHKRFKMACLSFNNATMQDKIVELLEDFTRKELGPFY